jgi:hypothetical protein
MMVKLGLERLVRWMRPHQPWDAVDAADVGTAFGMELSFEAAEAERPRSPPQRRPRHYRPSLYWTSKSKT